MELAAIKQQKLFNKYQGFCFFRKILFFFFFRPSKCRKQGQVTHFINEAERELKRVGQGSSVVLIDCNLYNMTYA